MNETVPVAKPWLGDAEVEAVRRALASCSISFREGDIRDRQRRAEALRTEVQHFADCVESGRRPITDGAAGLHLVRICEAGSKSMAERGRLVECDDF